MKKRERTYHVYILTNKSNKVLYTGMTGIDLIRILQHRRKLKPGFTSRYNINKLVYWEEFEHVLDAIAREKQIKRWSRKKKIALIEKYNPEWKDLYYELIKKYRRIDWGD
jgi:putative endonuclease